MDTYDPKCFSCLIIRALLYLFIFSNLWNTFKLNIDIILLNKLNNELTFSGYSLQDYIPWLGTVNY